MNALKKTLIMLVISTFCAFNTLNAQVDNSPLKILIKDSVKTINVNTNEKINDKLRSSVFNRKIRFKITLINNADSIIYTYLNFQKMIGLHYYIIDLTQAHRPVYNINEVINDSDYTFDNSDTIFYPIGFFYTIFNKNSSYVSIKRHGHHMPYMARKKSDRIIDGFFRKGEREDKKIKKNIKILNIENEETIKKAIYYRQFKKWAKSVVFYYLNLNKGVYYITFYYSFFIQDLVKEHHFEYEVFKNDVERNQINTDQIFQGCIKSNTVKLIVK